tara:strand:+ start:45 stop:155 length:111 start_codon:yes stop_codon:yes gene_type:complete
MLRITNVQVDFVFAVHNVVRRCSGGVGEILDELAGL